ncbi:MAG: hypothetical protein OXC62_15785, partial [Aestuariivita sp.]|nr:hypothetical protein [Aestuariivita sp.]
IQTVHSFCAGLLRRFPLEAKVSLQFSKPDTVMVTSGRLTLYLIIIILVVAGLLPPNELLKHITTNR